MNTKQLNKFAISYTPNRNGKHVRDDLLKNVNNFVLKKNKMCLIYNI